VAGLHQVFLGGLGGGEAVHQQQGDGGPGLGPEPPEVFGLELQEGAAGAGLDDPLDHAPEPGSHAAIEHRRGHLTVADRPEPQVAKPGVVVRAGLGHRMQLARVGRGHRRGDLVGHTRDAPFPEGPGQGLEGRHVEPVALQDRAGVGVEILEEVRTCVHVEQDRAPARPCQRPPVDLIENAR